jgi:hypothetical protein
MKYRRWNMKLSKRDIYRLSVEAFMETGLSKADSIMRTANKMDGVNYSTVERAMRKVNIKKNRKRDLSRGKRMIVIPDCQVKVGCPTDHIDAAARYVVEQRPDIILCLGDFWDMPSLSVFNSVRAAEGLRMRDDLDAGNNAMNSFMDIVRRGIKKKDMPRLVFLFGNHTLSVRLKRFMEKHPEVEGMIHDETEPFLEKHGWEVYPFLDVVDIEGIQCSHYIQNPHSLKGAPLGGAIDTMMKNAGHSFIMGHQQTYKYGKHFLSDGSVRIGIVAGAFYQHDEDYMSIQGNKHWRGIFMLNEVKNGNADMCEVSMDFLLRNYGEDK